MRERGLKNGISFALQDAHKRQRGGLCTQDILRYLYGCTKSHSNCPRQRLSRRRQPNKRRKKTKPKDTKNKANETSHAIYCKTTQKMFCRMTFTFICFTYLFFCLAWLGYTLLCITFVGCVQQLGNATMRRWKPRRDSRLGLGRNRNRNRGLSGVKLAAPTKAKVMTFWQTNRKCLEQVYVGVPNTRHFAFPSVTSVTP